MEKKSDQSKFFFCEVFFNQNIEKSFYNSYLNNIYKLNKPIKYIYSNII